MAQAKERLPLEEVRRQALALPKGEFGLERALRQPGLSALVEAHDEAEAEMALDAGAGIIGVNNRNRKDFSVNTDNSRRLREQIPSEVLFVSESRVSSPEDVARLRDVGADAVLIGETLMRAPDKAVKLAELRGTL